MTYLRYYEAERERWPQLAIPPRSTEEAEEALRRLCRHFKIRPPTVRWTSGRNFSRANERLVTLNFDDYSWRTLAHELAHTWDRQRLLSRRPYGWTVGKIRWHCQRHAKLVDRLASYVVKRGWHVGLLHQERLARRARADARRRGPLSPEEQRARRIAQQRARLEDVDRKLRRLGRHRTRLLRSIAGLERAARQAASRGPKEPTP
jgi:hypothetical protein